MYLDLYIRRGAMVTLKQALDLVRTFQTAYRKGIYNVDTSTFMQEEKIRTQLARAIACDNPPLDPNNPKDLHNTSKLPMSTVLSADAESIFVEYQTLLLEKFNLQQNEKSHKTISGFADIRETFKSLRQYSKSGAAMTWSPSELTAFHRLCVRLGCDNNMSTDEIMSNFTEFQDLKVNEASIYLAKRLFEIMQV